jgi:hypothetical protein
MMKWWLLVAGAGLALLVAAWIVGRDSAEPLETYRTGGLSFEHPASWHVLAPAARSARSEVFAYASTDRLEDPCRLSFDTVSCDWPLGRLSRSGALVTVSRSADGFREMRGVRTTIGGRKARVQIRRPGVCNAIGGDYTMLTEIESDRSNHYLVISCLRDSNGAGERDARRLVSSIHFDREA